MKIKVNKPTEVDVESIRISVPVRYGDEDMPLDFPFRTGDLWDITVDLTTRKIKDWPSGWSRDVEMKVCDGGSYWLLDKAGSVIASIEEDYVPNEIIPGEYGDYICLSIADDGTITNWPRKPNLSEFWNR